MAKTTWNDLIAALPAPHLLQTSQWAEVKQQGGWRAIPLVWNADGCDQWDADLQVDDVLAACLLLVKPFSARLGKLSPSIAYCPKGPNLDWNDTPLRQRVLGDLLEKAKEQNAIFLKIDADILIASGEPGAEDEALNANYPVIMADVSTTGFRPSEEQIQFRNTVLVDVTADAETLLARMKQKTRYNVRLAIKKGVTVRRGSLADSDLLYDMYAETAARDGFIIREKAYYQQVWKIFEETAAPLIAEVDGEPIAAVYLFHFAGTAYYIYGMSRSEHREKMPNALLQYEAMLWAKQRGCSIYDLWGAPDEFDESDSMWGVYKFKLGFNGVTRRTPGAYDAPLRPMLYWLYTGVMPRVLAVTRRLAKARQGKR